ncbi:DUF3375 family protein [Streptomyces sp. NPDC005811]|uniref:DUF3375 family protein n=1 Tax=Streptomyces sp. NPDC005811 TaxID=3154565 RepID=UPI00340182DA
MAGVSFSEQELIDDHQAWLIVLRGVIVVMTVPGLSDKAKARLIRRLFSEYIQHGWSAITVDSEDGVTYVETGLEGVGPEDCSAVDPPVRPKRSQNVRELYDGTDYAPLHGWRGEVGAAVTMGYDEQGAPHPLVWVPTDIPSGLRADLWGYCAALSVCFDRVDVEPDEDGIYYVGMADFREVEANFRDLDRDLRSKIAAWDGAKGELLDEVLGSRESIAEPDRGRTFQAFYDFLLAPSRQDELKTPLAAVEAMEAIGEPDPRMRSMVRGRLEAAEGTQTTVRQLSDQLRRFLDDQVRSEDRRVLQLVRGIEAQALALRDMPGVDLVAGIDAGAPAIVLPMERPLYAPVLKAAIDSTGIQAGNQEFTAEALFAAVYVDPAASPFPTATSSCS